ncbi:sensor histidine kinase N-terminal domain-containing protein [Variovorax sp. PCZ-1]|nr:sensor histidine kinase N-terminal domain-containing protein [Variovorax sp. PCZ-1]
MMAGLRSRLLVMLLVPLVVLLCISAWLDFRAAGTAAIQQDLNLQRLSPLLASSIVAEGSKPDDPPVVLLTPAIEDFIKDRTGQAEWGVATVDGRVIIGPSWLSSPTPATIEPEFHSEETGGVMYRIMAQRADTAAGEYVLLLADGSDARQSWLRSLLLKVLLPNGLLIAAVIFAVSWAVARALKPLTDITRAVEQRSPRDLSELDSAQSPPEVRPLVESLNRLFGLVNAQSESQRRFIADAAHQLRTPLAGLQAQVEAWVQSAQASHINIYDEKSSLAVNKPAQGAITLRANELIRLRDATRRTSQLATQLLALSRADAHSMGQAIMQSVDLAQLCADVLEQQFDSATERGIDLGLEIDRSAPMIVPGHEWLLRELLTNLCDNAIRYTAQAHKLNASLNSTAQVTLIAKPHQTGFLLQVRDNGSGIAPEEREKVLRRFYRVQGTGGEGNGLGLAIAQEIAKLHGSQLKLDDAEPLALLGARGLLVSVYLHARPAGA